MAESIRHQHERKLAGGRARVRRQRRLLATVACALAPLLLSACGPRSDAPTAGLEPAAPQIVGIGFAGTVASRVDVADARPDAPWYVALARTNLSLVARRGYLLSFWAKSAAGQTIDAEVQQQAAPYAARAALRVTLTDSWRLYSLAFTAPLTESGIKVQFNLARERGVVWIKAVSLTTMPAAGGGVARIPPGGVQDFPRLASLYGYVSRSQAPAYRHYGLVVAPVVAGPDGAVLALKRLSPSTRILAYLDSSAVQIAGFDGMRIYPGWWLTLAGTRLAAPLSATSRVVQVANARIIARQLARFPDVLVDGESMHVLSVDVAHHRLIVRRGYHSTAVAHAAGARLAAHASNWPGSWMLNLTPYCPVDPRTGLTWSGALARRAAQVLATGPWDGIYYDNANASWAALAGGQLDANRDNIPDSGNGPSGAGWRDGERTLFSHTRSLTHAALLLGNGEYYPALSNGRELEHFPNFEDGWSRAFGIYMNLAGTGAPAPTTIVNADTGNTGRQRTRDMRFYLAAALMGDGYFAYDAGTLNHGQTWWYDEYDDGAGSSLIRPLDARQATLRLAPGTARRFRAGDVIDVPGGVAAHDDEQMLIKALRGDTLLVVRGYRGSARMAHPEGSKVATAAQLAAGQGWLGRPLGPATIAGGNGSGQGAQTWLNPWSFSVAGQAAAAISPAPGEAGGDSGVWRRDFAHGTVLLNGTGEPQLVVVGASYWRIAGTQERAVNSGAPASIVSLAPWDALLLVKR